MLLRVNIHICSNVFMYVYIYVCVCKYVYISIYACMSLQQCLTVCDPMDCSLPGFSFHEILQARVLE